VRASGSATVRASGSATVEAYGSATVEAYGSATVRAYGSATVGRTTRPRCEASGSATVEASGSATVEAYGSATVEAYGSATVRASGSATVEAYGSATVRAYGSATVRASGSATVRASGSATVEAYGSATVEAYGSATVRALYGAKVTAGPHVAVHLHSAQAIVEGGVVIDVTQLDLTDPSTWADHNGVNVSNDGVALLYKAVNDELVAGRSYGKPTVYALGETVACDDWEPTNECGGGLHLSPTAGMAKTYNESATRFVEVAVPVADLRPIVGGTPKCKVASCKVLREIDLFMRPVAAKATAAVTA
jgi:hypothetical protein